MSTTEHTPTLLEQIAKHIAEVVLRQNNLWETIEDDYDKQETIHTAAECLQIAKLLDIKSKVLDILVKMEHSGDLYSQFLIEIISCEVED